MSMKIFANAMHRDLLAAGIDVELIAPKPVFGAIRQSATGLGKWLGYIDRFLLFPRDLRAVAAKADVVHLCDNASAMYSPMLKRKPVVVTCNDMIAVRGALGEIPECRASFFGRFLQKWICRGLRSATRVACISRSTFVDASRILGSGRNLCVILDALNYPYRPLPSSEVDRRLAVLPAIRAPYILHVGSNHARKNREGVLRIFAKVPKEANLQLVFAGDALSEGLIRLADELEVRDRVIEVVKPDVEVLEALYNRGAALLFPSLYEGFGWPTIEAQACGCPVVGSEIPSLDEVLGQSAVLKPVQNEEGMAASIARLAMDAEYRGRMVQLGFENVHARFTAARMIDQYVALYRELACQS